MKLSIIFCCLLYVASTTPTVFAIDPFRDAWQRYYVEPGSSNINNNLRVQVKCNVCHVDRDQKKSLNEYGSALFDNGLSINNFPRERFEREPEIVQREIEEIFRQTANTPKRLTHNAALRYLNQ